MESQDQIVHHRNLDLKKPAVRLSQFQEYPTQTPRAFVNLFVPRAVAFLINGLPRDVRSGSVHGLFKQAKAQAQRKNRAHLNSVQKIGWMTR